ncbi:hypothetical protein [Mycoplasmopsis caviae]|nr:hypothetical protein [Mycoplasmopsis caviae]VDR42456.1 Uncharacterised protein [Mycoplasmopsis caviae]
MDQLAIAAVQDRKTYVSIVELKAINKSLGDKIVELEKDNKALREEIEKLKNEKNYCARK